VIAVLAGGVGAAKFLRGLINAQLGEEIVAIVNTGDDWWRYGLRICPDLDTVTYTLADMVNPATGWGLRDETFAARTTLELLGDDPWFTLGDRDLGLHMLRTQLLRSGASLTTVTQQIVERLGIDATLLPMTDDEVATKVTVQLPTDDTGADEIVELDFQEYFVRFSHQPRVLRVRYAGIDRAQPTQAVVQTLADARLIIIAPSNPILSIGPILALHGIQEQLSQRARAGDVIAVSPIIAGEAVKGPLADLLESLMHQHDARTVANLYLGVASELILDTADTDLAESIRALGLTVRTTDTLMTDLAAAVDLATFVTASR